MFGVDEVLLAHSLQLFLDVIVFRGGPQRQLILLLRLILLLFLIHFLQNIYERIQHLYLVKTANQEVTILCSLRILLLQDRLNAFGKGLDHRLELAGGQRFHLYFIEDVEFLSKIPLSVSAFLEQTDEIVLR